MGTGSAASGSASSTTGSRNEPPEPNRGAVTGTGTRRNGEREQARPRMPGPVGRPGTASQTEAQCQPSGLVPYAVAGTRTVREVRSRTTRTVGTVVAAWAGVEPNGATTRPTARSATTAAPAARDRRTP